MALPNKTKIPVGTVLAGKYRITREIGRGGMAAVYEAENVDIGKRVAIKVLAQELTTSAVVVERFLREARAAAAIRSPYICDVYDSGRLEDGRPFLVLELLEGESLYERMTKIRWLDVETTVTIVTQVVPRPHEGARRQHRPPRPEAREHLPHQGRGGAAPLQDPRFRPRQVLRADGGRAARRRGSRARARSSARPRT